MPLSAQVDGDRVVSIMLTDDEWAALRDDARAKRRAVTMACGWPGLAKTSKLGTPYFAHKPGGDGCSAGETAQHLLAKAIIVTACINAGWDAQPEERGDGWVADVMAARGDVRVAFEIQWSNQTLDDYRLRQQRYSDAGIASTAWFARHTGHLPGADKTLPVFRLNISDNGEATVQVGRATLPLAEAVKRLLTRRLQHRDYLANGQPATAIVEAAEMDCYRCKTHYGVWNVREIHVQGRCGDLGRRGRGVGVFPPIRPENEPEVRAAGQRLAESMGLPPARIFSRRTQTSGTRYMAFTCPKCNATCGDMFVANEFATRRSGNTTKAAMPPTAYHQPHWCIAGESDTCAIPPTEVIQELSRAEDDDSGHGLQAGIAMTRVGVPGGISIDQAVSRMLGNY